MMNLWVIPALAAAVVALLTGIILRVLFTDERRVGRRLRRIERDGDGERLREEQDGRAEHLPQLASLLERAGRYSSVERQLKRAGLNWRPSEFAAACLALVAALALAGWLVFKALGAAVAIAVGVALPTAALKALEARRLRRFEHQLPDALMLIATSLRSGYGVLRAIQAVADGMVPPISSEFKEVLDESRVGVPVGGALSRLLERVPLPDLEIAVTAILIQMDVGGNLAELMETVAATVRERHRLRGEMDTLTAEARLSGVVLFLVPVGAAVILVTLNRAYMATLLQTTLGHLLIAGAAALQIMGGLVIRRMLRFDF